METMQIPVRTSEAVNTENGYSSPVTETANTAETNHNNHVAPERGFHLHAWLATGIIICAAASLLFLSQYSAFKSRVESYQENPIETTDNIRLLYQLNQVLYHDLYNIQNETNISYSDLYYPMDENISANITAYIDTESHFTASEDVTPQLIENEAYMSLIHNRNHLESMFDDLEVAFDTLSVAYDYIIYDTVNGTKLTNAPDLQALSDSDDYYFLLQFDYDASGHPSVGAAVKGNDAALIRRYASALTRSLILPSESFEASLSDLSDFYLYASRRPMTNCTIIYGLRADVWQEMMTGSLVISHEWYDTIRYDQYSNYARAGIGSLAFFLLVIVFCFALFLPYTGRGKARPWEQTLICQLSLEGVILIMFLALPFTSCTLSLVRNTINGSYLRSMNIGILKMLTPNSLKMLLYLFNFCCLFVYFMAAWYVGVCVRPIWEMGPRGYLKARSYTYRFFPYIRRKAAGFYYELTHMDITKNALKMIVKVVVINGIAIFLLSLFWRARIALAVIYSLILYIVLKKYVSDLQKDYKGLLNVTNEIAQGNLNVSMDKDLGVFEPFKPQVARIQQGFQKAVQDEVKSQRMKTELITNVSHDLKTPLTAIITYIGLLKDETITGEQREEYLDTLERKSLRLKVLIEDLFEISKATSKTVRLDIMDVDIMNLVKQAQVEMSDRLDEARLDVRMNLPEEKTILRLDSQKTYRIYENLFVNIAKYALPGTRVYVFGTVTADEVLITMKNISAAELHVDPSELTDRFVRGDESRNTEGSGLGLAIAKSFVELQGGQLIIELDDDIFKVTTIWRRP